MEPRGVGLSMFLERRMKRKKARPAITAKRATISSRVGDQKETYIV